MHLPLLSNLEDGRVSYHTTQAQSVPAILSAHFFFLNSSLYPRHPPPHPSEQLIHHLLLGFYFLTVLKGRIGTIQMTRLLFHTCMLTFG